jgi:cholesterol oxidase
VITVGSGFGGSVTALRLTEKGYRVGVTEAGRRFTPGSLPKNCWDIKNHLWHLASAGTASSASIRWAT